jgi:hypothetical protein
MPKAHRPEEAGEAIRLDCWLKQCGVVIRIIFVWIMKGGVGKKNLWKLSEF